MSILGVPVSSALAGTAPASFYAIKAVTEWRDEHIDNPLSKYVVAELAFAGVSIFSALETLANAVYTLILKGVSFFISDKAAYETHRLQPQLTYTVGNFLMLNVALLSLKKNFNTGAMGTRACFKVRNFYTRS